MFFFVLETNSFTVNFAMCQTIIMKQYCTYTNKNKTKSYILTCINFTKVFVLTKY